MATSHEPWHGELVFMITRELLVWSRPHPGDLRKSRPPTIARIPLQGLPVKDDFDKAGNPTALGILFLALTGIWFKKKKRIQYQFCLR